LSRLRENFGLKMIYSFVAVIVVVQSAFTLFAFVRESGKVKAELREQGEMLSGLLARTAIVGVFAENNKMLMDATEGIMGINTVVSVSIYNTDFKILYTRGKTPTVENAFPLPDDRMSALRRAQSLIIEESPNAFEFLRPIMIKSVLNTDESLYFEHPTEGESTKTIGYAKIVLSKAAYHKALNSMVMRNAILMVIFITSSFVIVYVAVKKITRPLATLTESVKAIEKGRRVEQVPVETGDEIGNLASAFNAMIVARGLAEESLRAAALEMSSMESRIEERERHFIASDLHDFVGQNLAVLLFKLAALRKDLSSSPELLGRLEEIRELIGKTIQYTRSLTVELSPPVLSQLGFVAAVESLAEGIQKTFGIRTRVTDDGRFKQTDDETRYLLFRIVRELLMNIVKHAQASDIKICLAGSENIMHIAVEDNGIGFDPEKVSVSYKGFGLYTIRERLKRLGGYFEIDSRPGFGTKVILSAPLKGGTEDKKRIS